jgi:predicted N-acyltransferase
MSLKFEFVSSIEQINAEQWNKMNTTRYPFIQHAFIYALEQSGSATDESGWKPHHLIVRDADELVAVVPLFLKNHSYGEYVFDWAWADAYQRHGLNYYPKLLNAIPFTPVTGPRILINKEHDNNTLEKQVIEQLIDEAQKLGISSIHALFNEEKVSKALTSDTFMQRRSVQFQWFNRNYTDFDHFLASFASRKRKNVKKERKKVFDNDVTISRLVGSEITTSDMNTFYHCYQQTYLKRSGHGGYLTRTFFNMLLASMPDNLMLVIAEKQGVKIAAALYLKDDSTLYGRYWGALDDVDGLHFECCYYQGIEFCIQNKLKSFNPGTQGEHKIMRGFEPIFCYSNHWIAHPDFKRAIHQFLIDEHTHISAYKTQAETYLPFKVSSNAEQ